MDIIERLKIAKNMSYLLTSIWFLLACFSSDLFFLMISIFNISVSLFVVFIVLTFVWSIFWALFLRSSKNKLVKYFEYFGIYIASFILFACICFFYVDCLFWVDYSSYNLVVILLGIQNVGLIYYILCLKSNIKEINYIISGTAFYDVVNKNKSFQNISRRHN